MKNTVIAIVLLFSSFTAKAQVDIALNPVALLFEALQASVEYNASNDWGIGLDILAAPGAYLLYANGKYYFTPKYGCDGFNIGVFAGAVGDNDGEGTGGLGFLVGYKAVSQKRLVFEIGLGAGRGFNSDFIEVIPYFKLNLGYRFGMKK